MDSSSGHVTPLPAGVFRGFPLRPGTRDQPPRGLWHPGEHLGRCICDIQPFNDKQRSQKLDGRSKIGIAWFLDGNHVLH